MLGSYVSVAGEAKNDSAAVYGVGGHRNPAPFMDSWKPAISS